MPVALDPRQTHEYVLKSDEDKPKGSRPTFVFRYMTKGELMQFDGWRKTEDPDDIPDALDNAVALSLVGWRHMQNGTGKAIPFRKDKSRAGDVCQIEELIELQDAVLTANMPSADEKKGSGSRSPSSSARSANTATRQAAKARRQKRRGRR